MKTFSLVLLCSLVCSACSRPLTTLSDGQPGYAITCDTVRDRCIEEIVLSCRGKGYTIVSERAEEMTPPGWVDRNFRNRYWMEARCNPSDSHRQ